MTTLFSAATTKFGELWNSDIEDIAQEVLEKIAESSHKDPLFPQATVFFGSSLYPLISGDTGFPHRVMQNLHWKNTWQSLWGDETIGASIFDYAWQQVALGIIPSAIVCAVDKTTDWKHDILQETISSTFSHEELLQGLTRDSYFALLAQKYLTAFGLSADCLDIPPLVAHQNAVGNLNAQFPKTITSEQIALTPYFAQPLRMLHGTAPADGAAAVYITSTQNLANPHCRVSCFGTSSSATLADLSLQCTGLEKKDVVDKFSNLEVVDLSDYSAILPLLLLENMEIAPKGHASEWIAKTGKGYNPDGGCKAFGDPPGASALRQIISVCNTLTPGKTGIAVSVGSLATQGRVSIISKVGEE